MNLALLTAAATGVQVGAAIVATRYVVAEVPPLTLALLRYAIGVATLLPFAWHALRSGRRWPQATHPRRDLAAMAALGIGQFAVLIALLNFGLQTVGAARGALIFSLFPVLTLLLATAAGRERWNAALAAGVALSVAGVMLDVVPRLASGGEAPLAWPGALAVLGSALTGAVCSVAYRPYLQRYPTLPVSAFAMGASVLFLAVLALAGGSGEGSATGGDLASGASRLSGGVAGRLQETANQTIVNAIKVEQRRCMVELPWGLS